jgi:hypothetical protein
MDTTEYKMATGKIRAGNNFVNPYSHVKIRTRTRARNPSQHETTPVTAIRGYSHTRGRARVPASFRKPSTHYISTTDKYHLFKKTNKSKQTNKLVSYMNI